MSFIQCAFGEFRNHRADSSPAGILEGINLDTLTTIDDQLREVSDATGAVYCQTSLHSRLPSANDVIRPPFDVRQHGSPEFPRMKKSLKNGCGHKAYICADRSSSGRFSIPVMGYGAPDNCVNVDAFEFEWPRPLSPGFLHTTSAYYKIRPRGSIAVMRSYTYVNRKHQSIRTWLQSETGDAISLKPGALRYFKFSSID
jgi:hypothetical protein